MGDACTGSFCRLGGSLWSAYNKSFDFSEDFQKRGAVLGGLIGIGAEGHAIMTFNSPGVYRAVKGVVKKSKTGEPACFVGIYGAEN